MKKQALVAVFKYDENNMKNLEDNPNNRILIIFILVLSAGLIAAILYQHHFN